MGTFSFYIDTKVTEWYRTKFEIESEDEETAKKMAIEFVNKDNHWDISWDKIDDTTETMSVVDNDGQSTEELYNEPAGELIWANGEV